MTPTVASWIAVGVATASCGSGTAGQAAPSAPERKEAAMSSSVSPAGDRHPGQITYVDHVEHRTWTERAAEVPTTMAWVKVDDHWKAVVQIEIQGAANRREITKFGANHEFLETTTATMGPPPTPSDPDPVPVPVPTPSK